MRTPIEHLNLKKSPNGDVTQWFGENPALYSRFGLEGHNGIDIVRPHGTPMYAVEDGVVISVRNNPSGFGKHIRFMSDYQNEKGYRREWVYGHNADNLVSVGDRVKEGDHIANMGNTGFVVSGATPFWKTNPYAGTHLHIGLRLIREKEDGWSYPGSDKKVDIVDYGNGYKGAIDPRPFLEATNDVPEVNKKMYQQLLTIQSIINSIRRALLGR